MSAERLQVHRLEELVRLHRMNDLSVREIARLLQISPNTERRYRQALEAEGLLKGSPSELPSLTAIQEAIEQHYPSKTANQEVSTAEPWSRQIESMWSDGCGAQAIYDKLRTDESGFNASVWAVKRMVTKLNKNRPVEASDVVIRVETQPGEIAQVDFGYVGRLVDPESGEARKAWAFVMVLGFSRYMWAYLVFDQRIETWQQLHVGAIKAMGGVPRTFVPDNLKAAVIRACFSPSEEPALNRSYREVAKHYGFKVDPTPPFAPQKKGKVESGVKYLKRNFINPRNFEDINDANSQLGLWLEQVANARIHGTTGRRPSELFAEEQLVLAPLPERQYEPVRWHKARVYQDSHFLFERRNYPVPWRFIGKEVWVKATQKHLVVYYDNVRIIDHPRGVSPSEEVMSRCLPEHRGDYRHRSPEWWLEQAREMSPLIGDYIYSVFESDEVLSKLRTVQAMMSLLKRYPIGRAEAACARASFYDNHNLSALKGILEQGLDAHPLPTAMSPAHGVLSSPTYARTPRELLSLPLEVTHEPN